MMKETAEGFARNDYSAEGWTGPPADAIGFWKSRVPTSSKAVRPVIEDSVVLDFFQRLSEDQDQNRKSFRYILALLLIRRKLFRLAEVRREGGQEIFVLLRVGSGEEHAVPKPDLSDDKLAALQTEVEKLLLSP